jgi:hypothetical protein
MVIYNGRRLTRADFAALRAEATGKALQQRRLRDRLRDIRRHKSLSRTRLPLLRRDTTNGRVYRQSRPLDSYRCPVCGDYRALPFSPAGYRCLLDGVYLRRTRFYERVIEKSRGLALARSLSP